MSDQENKPAALTADQRAAILRFDTCAIANAIELFNVRLRNEGYTSPGLRCLTKSSPKILGYAATGRLKTSNPPPAGHSYYDRTDWWNYIETILAPRIVVIEDIDPHPGLGSAVGEVHASILQALQCVGLVTNGSVRDLPELTGMGFSVFAPHVSLSHAYNHMVDFGQPVKVGGLSIQSGELLYADCHGVISIPHAIAADVPAAAARLARKDREIVDYCRSREFSLEGLRAKVKEMS